MKLIRFSRGLAGLCLAATAAGAALAGPNDYVGQVSIMPQPWCPRGTLPLDGRPLAIAQYVDLFIQLDCTYSAPNCEDSGHFFLPDMRGRTPVGVGAGPRLTPQSRGQKGGAQQFVIDGDDLEPHDHLVYFSALDPSQNDPRGHAIPTVNPTANPAYSGSPTGNSQMHQNTVSIEGGSQPVSLYQHSQPLMFCIATRGPSPVGAAGAIPEDEE